MRDLTNYDLQHNGGFDTANPGEFGALWALTDATTNQVVAEGKGNTEHLAQQRFKQDLLNHGWDEADVEALVKDEPDWIV